LWQQKQTQGGYHGGIFFCTSQTAPWSSLGDKSKSSTSQVNEPLDVSAAHLNPPPPSIGNVFSFFALDGAQCREQQRVPLKFTKFMDGQELHEAII
jgi:hypothetical protein